MECDRYALVDGSCKMCYLGDNCPETFETLTEPKSCNRTGACLSCPGSQITNTRAATTIRNSHSPYTQLYFSSECTRYVPGGVHSQSFVFQHSPTVEIFADQATLQGILTFYTDATLFGSFTTNFPIEIRSPTKHFTISGHAELDHPNNQAGKCTVEISGAKDIDANINSAYSKEASVCIVHSTGNVKVQQCKSTSPDKPVPNHDIIVLNKRHVAPNLFVSTRRCQITHLGKILQAFSDSEMRTVGRKEDNPDTLVYAKNLFIYSLLATVGLSAFIVMVHSSTLYRAVQVLNHKKKALKI